MTVRSRSPHGTVVLNGDESYTYSPDDPSFFDTDSFTYKVSDGALDSNTATVFITR